MKQEPPVHAPGCRIASEIAEARSRLVATVPAIMEAEDAMIDNELSKAAACYLLNHLPGRGAEGRTVFNWFWPWQEEAFQPSVAIGLLQARRADLLTAATAIVADIERIDRELAERATLPNHVLDGDKPEEIV